jgi:hypothetical protein
MALRLTVFRPDGTTVSYAGELADAITQAAAYARSLAAEDPLAGPSADYVEEALVRRATQTLRRPGDAFRGPAGAVWVVSSARRGRFRRTSLAGRSAG